jgi:hypothetical protein
MRANPVDLIERQTNWKKIVQYLEERMSEEGKGKGIHVK